MTIDGINLAKLSDSKLFSIVAELTADENVKAQYDHLCKYFPCQIKRRAAVIAAGRAIDAWKAINTVREVVDASPETKAWTDFGGSIIHHEPTFSL